jgi:hypothetical protein
MKLHTLVGLLLITSLNLAFSKPLTVSNTLTVREIPLNTVNKTFKKDLSKKLNKKDCEKKTFVKKAHVSSDGKLLNVDLTPRITRQYCTRRAKKQIYEKTKSIRFSYLLTIDEGKVLLTESSNNAKQYAFERSLTDVIGVSSKKAVAEAVKEILGLNNDTNPQLHYQSIELDSGKITVKFIVEE